ncbi:MAG TPA: tol-pal system protein YbgF [Myxococcota bacterium]|nr:tol-pal system protein YbgF [Myxococcota bacterium]
MSATALRRLLAAASIFALSGCVTVPEFQALRRKVDALEKGGHASAQASDEWSKASSTSSSSTQSSGNRLADLDAEVSSLRDEVSRLQGEVDALKKDLDKVKGGSSAAAGNPSAAPAPTEGSPASGGPAPVPTPGAVASANPAMTPATGTPAPSVAPAPTPPEGGSASSEEVRDYENAFGLYRAGKYADAIDRFQAFLQTHPSSEFADNALFWMGESYFKLNDFEQAAVAFDRVVKRFPKGNKVPDALYRQGVSLQEIGNRTGQQSTYGPAACQIFKRIADDYPSSERVAEARRQLEKCPS